jgi:hypothetical protein
MKVEMDDLLQRPDALRITDEKRRQLLLPDLNQMRRVGTVITTHHQQQIHLLLQHLEQGILPLLCRPANRIEHGKSRIIPIPLQHRLPHPPLDLFRLALQHRRLVRHAHPQQMQLGIKLR